MQRLSAALIAGIMAFSLSACREDDGSGYVFKYDITANPGTLDPQIANDPNAETIIENVFMGLLTANADGSLSEGCAEDWAVSDDGLVYTFHLRQDVYWIDSEDFLKQCTAEDFVYGFRRLFLPETRAPRAEEYHCIKNSKAISMGVLPDAAQLGVRAINEFELEITLTEPNPRFPVLLTEPPAMPCCEEYFLKAQGKYGLSAECTPSNGAFYVRSWAYDPYTITDNNNLILRRNAKNSEARQVFPSGLNFFIEDGADYAENFAAGVTSCVAVTDAEAAQISGEYNVERFSNITTGLVFNRKYSLFRSEEFRAALAMLVDRESFAAAVSHYDAAQALVPAEVSMLNKSYRELAGSDLCLKYDPEGSRELFESVREKLDSNLFKGARIITSDSASAEAVSYIMQEWQRELGFYCRLETLSEEQYRARLNSGDYEIAVVDLTGGYNSPAAYMEHFSGNGTGLGGFFDAEFNALMKSAETAADLKESAEIFAEAEKILLNKAAFVPLFYKNEFFFSDADCADIVYNPFSKTVSFSEAKRF